MSIGAKGEANRTRTRPGLDSRSSQSPFIQGGIVAGWAAALGDPGYALEQLRGLPAGVRRTFAFSVWRPVFRDMRKLPEFKAFVRDVGFVDYWRKSGHWGDFCHPVRDDDFECD